MQDSLQRQIESGIPDPGVRMTVLLIIVFALVVFTFLMYIKMKEADKKAGLE